MLQNFLTLSSLINFWEHLNLEACACFIQLSDFNLSRLQSFQYWLDRDKCMNQQIGLTGQEPLLRFTVKFYIPDPSQLEEEYTRYLFSLQVRRDLAHGHLQCNDNTAALMASYIVQGESYLSTS